MMENVGCLIGERLGDVQEVECSLGGVAWGRCLRVRIILDVTKPLCRGTIVNMGYVKTTVLFRYEKLSDFCFIYGIHDHSDKDCLTIFETLDAESMAKRHFWSWLRAEGRRGITIEDIQSHFVEFAPYPSTPSQTPAPSPLQALMTSRPVQNRSCEPTETPAAILNRSSSPTLEELGLSPIMINVHALQDLPLTLPGKGNQVVAVDPFESLDVTVTRIIGNSNGQLGFSAYQETLRRDPSWKGKASIPDQGDSAL